jgi:hypothetical protein
MVAAPWARGVNRIWAIALTGLSPGTSRTGCASGSRQSSLKKKLGLERHGGRVPAGLWARVVQRLLALNAAIWHNWQIGAPVKRSLIAYDH